MSENYSFTKRLKIMSYYSGKKIEILLRIFLSHIHWVCSLWVWHVSVVLNHAVYSHAFYVKW